MTSLEVAEISIDEVGQLHVRPRRVETCFEYVYRAGAGVDWDPTHKSFRCSKPKEWSQLQWFQHAWQAVRSELGYELKLDDRTAWTNVPSSLREEIVALFVAG